MVPLLMSTHDIYFCGEIRKKISILFIDNNAPSGAMMTTLIYDLFSLGVYHATHGTQKCAGWSTCIVLKQQSKDQDKSGYQFSIFLICLQKHVVGTH